MYSISEKYNIFPTKIDPLAENLDSQNEKDSLHIITTTLDSKPEPDRLT